MTSRRIALAYCQDNQATAREIDQALSGTVPFEHFNAGSDAQGQPLSEQLAHFDGRVVLLVSDNFLRSPNCMYQAQRILSPERQVLPVVIDGETYDENSGQTVRVETSFERVSDIIQYINHWQDRYLDLRKQRREFTEVGGEPFEIYLRKVRDISSETGEFLRMLRGTWHVTFREFTTDAFHQFFIFIEEENTWEEYKARYRYQQPRQAAMSGSRPDAHEEEEEAAPVDVQSIPGMHLLHDRDSGGQVEEVVEEPLQPHLEGTVPPEQPAGTESDFRYSEVEDVSQLSAAALFEDRNGLSTEVEHEEQPEPEPQPVAEEQPEPEVMRPQAAVSEGESASDDAADETELDQQAANWIRKAWSMADGGQVRDGLTLLTTALENYPGRTDLRYHYALMLAQGAEDIDHAREQLEIILQANPEHEDALFLLGEIADANNEPEHARHYFEQVIGLNEEYPDGWYRLATIIDQNFPEDRREAARAFKKAAKQDEDNADALYRYAQLLIDPIGDTDKAIKYLRKTLKADLQHPQAHYDLAQLYLQRGDMAAARAEYFRAVQLHPELKTPENEQRFSYQPTPAPEQALAPPAPRRGEAVGASKEHATMFEHDALLALKENISRLESLLTAREEEADRLRSQRPGAGKTVLISGATSGIGRATAELFARNGYRLILTGRREDRLNEVRETFSREHEAEVLTLPFDVRDQAAVQRMVDELPEEWRNVDILINNAGKAKGLSSIHQGQLEHWEEMIDTNIKGLLYLTRAVTPHMVDRRHGHVINVCSTAGKEVYPGGNVYSATKFAVDALTKSMRLDLHTHGIRVSQVSPAHVEQTEFALVRFDGDADRARIYEDFKPLEAADVAETIYFIASRPAHVNVLDVVVQGTQQASSTLIDRSGRDRFGEEE